MTRSLFVALLAAASTLAAPVPKTTVKDYQKLADETEWTFTDRKDLSERLADEFKGYQAAVIAAEGRSITIRVTDDKKAELLKWESHAEVSFAQRGGIVYYTDHGPISSGCAVIAFDLNAKKQLWKADLKGLGPIAHSKYRNEVRLEVLDDDTLRVFGKESAGRYVGIVSRHTGKTLGHKVFAEKK
jgi:hypothetical protein